jgi:hypothetical protein
VRHFVAQAATLVFNSRELIAYDRSDVASKDWSFDLTFRLLEIQT